MKKESDRLERPSTISSWIDPSAYWMYDYWKTVKVGIIESVSNTIDDNSKQTNYKTENKCV